jgi:hypothetical protein
MECECTCRCMFIGKFLFFSNVCMSATVGNTINHALPRLHDIEAISRDSCHGAQARWYSGSYEDVLHRFYTKVE